MKNFLSRFFLFLAVFLVVTVGGSALVRAAFFPPMTRRNGQVVLPQEHAFVPLVMFLVTIAVYKLIVQRSDRTALVRLTTRWVTFFAAVAAYVMAGDGYTGAAWVAVGAVLAAMVVVRAVAQERYVRGAADRRRAQGRSVFAEAAFIESQNPVFFRWAHRALALVWIGDVVRKMTSEDVLAADGDHTGLALALVPGLLALLAGILGSVAGVVFFPAFILGAALSPVLVPWLLLNVVWGLVSALRTPTDRRTNAWAANSSFLRDTPWFRLI